MVVTLQGSKRGAIGSLNPDGTRNIIHPADVTGPYTVWRRVVALFLIGLYVGLPWVPINGNPAVFLDIANRQFHLFGLTFTPQDMWLVFFLITGLGFSLFYFTALIGRVWCGWACPQTVFIDHVYRRVERWMEGDSTNRKKLDATPWNGEKLFRRGSKQVVFALLSLLVAHVFISYFVSIPGLYRMITHFPLENWGVFLMVIVFSGILWFNFAWFREQFCVVLCPYGRLQSALLDEDSLVVGYDRIRGEPRGRKGEEGRGDCIDCLRCVRVCPTGIDIREGLQMECISCAACIDACDEIMKKIGRPKGLIRHASTREFAGGRTRWLRPRMILYSILLILGVAALTFALFTVRPVQVSLLRMGGAPYYVSDGLLRNHYLLRINNKRNEKQSFEIVVSNGPESLEWSGFQGSITVEALGEQSRPLIVTLPASEFRGTFSLKVQVKVEGSDRGVTKSVPFIGPVQ